MHGKLRALTLGLMALTASPDRALAQASFAPRDQFVQTAPDIRIHVVSAGPRTTLPTIVLIPGWRLTTTIWREQIDMLSKVRQVVAIDPRSQGESTKTADGDTPEDRARDLHEVLKALKPGPVVLVGWSQGVQDVAAYVGHFGVEGVKGIVLVDSTISSGASGVPPAPQAAAQQLRQASLYLRFPHDATEAMMRAIIRRPLPRPEFDRLVADALKTPTAIGAAMLVDDLLGPDRTTAYAKFTVPTLVVASASSPELGAQKAMAGHLPQASLHIIDNAGHAVFIDQPKIFYDLINEMPK